MTGKDGQTETKYEGLEVVSDSMYHFKAIANALQKEGYAVNWHFDVGSNEVHIVLRGYRPTVSGDFASDIAEVEEAAGC